MKLGVLSWERDEAESVGIAEKAAERGHEAVLFTIEDIRCASIPGGGTEPMIGSSPAREFDAVLSRAHIGYEGWRTTVERLHLLSTVPGLLMVDTVDTHVRAVSKFAMLHQLTTAGISVPETRSCTTVADARAAHEEWGAMVVKPSVGFGGIDVERFVGTLTERDTAQIAGALAKYGELICQRYCPHSGDLRVFVIDSRAVLAAQWHTSATAWKPFPGSADLEANWDSWVELVDPPKEAVDIAIRATEAMRLSYSGVDLVQSEGRYWVMEVNVVPGWEPLPKDDRDGMERAVIDVVEKRLAGRGETFGA
ncbi:RimK family alpha-L-glutamate ligase [Actinokineospora guangxiensis]|uniref:RimK family alpha-L-glutamate ligase n=1 Tax=Actinokineospora guangxiensis TaxID=1490288 RepID=A0ABW0ES15_9PSEU